MITPTSSKVTGSSRPRRLATMSTQKTATSAPANANPCCDATPSAAAIPASAGSLQMYAKSAAPLLTPSRYGSASGFRRIAWYATPAAASAAPTSDASSTISRRYSMIPSLGQPTEREPTIMQSIAIANQARMQTPMVASSAGGLHRLMGVGSWRAARLEEMSA
jgi:hypothetical protein